MIRLTVTLLSLAFFVAVTIRMALDGFFHPADWHAAIGMIASFSCLTILLLLIQRAVWRSSPRMLRNLSWPTAVAAGLVGLAGIATGLNDARLGGYVLLISLLTALGLWRTRSSANSNVNPN